MLRTPPTSRKKPLHPLQKFSLSWCIHNGLSAVGRLVATTEQVLASKASTTGSRRSYPFKRRKKTAGLRGTQTTFTTWFNLSDQKLSKCVKTTQVMAKKIKDRTISITKKSGVIYGSWRDRFILFWQPKKRDRGRPPKPFYRKKTFWDALRKKWRRRIKSIHKWWKPSSSKTSHSSKRWQLIWPGLSTVGLKIYQILSTIPADLWAGWQELWSAPATQKQPNSTKLHPQKTTQQSKRSFWPNWAYPQSSIENLGWDMLGSVVLSIGILMSSYSVYDSIFKDLPTAQDVLAYQPIVSTQILDRNDRLLYTIYKDENRTVVPLHDVSPHLINATISIEDQNFYHHFGFDPQAIFRAVVANLRGESVQGGSTLTQQLVKNTVLSNERTLQRKIRELLVAILVDASFTKDQILTMYLNEIAYGGSTYGIEEASRRYFNKPAADLSLAEASLLAGLPAAPSLYSPFGPHPERAELRQQEVLRRMVEDGFITQIEALNAANQELVFATDTTPIKAPHFVFYVRELLAEQFGEDAVNQGGLIVKTSLDLDLQLAAEEVVRSELASLQRLNVGNAASLVTNPQTGEVLAMVGSVDYFDVANDGQVNVTLRPRQPGSSIKPVVYAYALTNGKTPQTMIEDAPITYHFAGSPPYSPKNYDGKFRGMVSLRQALAASYNIPAVKLIAELGVNNVIDFAEQLGIDTWQQRNRFGLALALGGGEVTMTDMAEVYGTFATGGYQVDLNPILEVTTFNGELLYANDCALDQSNCPRRKVLDSRVAAQITSILSDNAARASAFGTQSLLNIPNHQVAVKTGTTNSYRDNWTDGYTSDRVVISWIGNNDNQQMYGVASGIVGATPIWNQTMRLVLNDEQPHRFEQPTDLIAAEICASTGTLPCSGCPRIVTDYFIPGTQPTQQCNPSWFRPKPTQNPEDRDQILQGVSAQSN